MGPQNRGTNWPLLTWGEPTSSPLEPWIGKWQGRLSGFSWIQKPLVKFLPNPRNGINSGVCYFKNINQILIWKQCGSIFSKKETIEAQLSSNSDPPQFTLGRYVLCQELALLGSSKLSLKPLSWTEIQRRMKAGETMTGMNSSLNKGDGKSTYPNGRLPRRFGSLNGCSKEPTGPNKSELEWTPEPYFHPSSKLS